VWRQFHALGTRSLILSGGSGKEATWGTRATALSVAWELLWAASPEVRVLVLPVPRKSMRVAKQDASGAALLEGLFCLMLEHRGRKQPSVTYKEAGPDFGRLATFAPQSTNAKSVHRFKALKGHPRSQRAFWWRARCADMDWFAWCTALRQRLIDRLECHTGMSLTDGTL